MSAIYLTNLALGFSPFGDGTTYKLRTSRGGGANSATTNTVAGPTAGVQCTSIAGSTTISWVSEPLASDVAFTSCQVNLRMSESSMSANVGAQAKLEVYDTEFVLWATIFDSENGTELGTTEAAQTWTPTFTSVNIPLGYRVRLVAYGNDIGTMASGFTFNIYYNGTTAGASGDSWINPAATMTEVGQRTVQQAIAAQAVNRARTYFQRLNNGLWVPQRRLWVPAHG